MLRPEFELQILREGKYHRIVGIDEVGRGCLAGPVAVGAYVFNVDTPVFEGVNDSKLVPAQVRSKLYKDLWDEDLHAIEYGTANEINNVGLGKLLHQLIFRHISRYDDERTLFLIDGRFAADFGLNSKQIIRGDFNFYSIAAASIVAKVQRDNLMRELDALYPGYGFARHKGYGTKQHRQAIQNLGICKEHRSSFRIFGTTK